MARSKTRTDDWIQLANAVTVARDVLRAGFPHANKLKVDLQRELQSVPRSSYAWVSTESLTELLCAYIDVGKRLTVALKGREER